MRIASSTESPLWARWEKTREKKGSKVLLIEAGTDISFSAQAVHEAAVAFAGKLAACAAGDRLAFRLPNGLEWMACFLAAQKKGVTAVPLDHGLPAIGCLEMARHTESKWLYLEGKFQEMKTPSRRSPGICCLKTTSGSSGTPKIIPCRAEHLLADGTNVTRTMGLRSTDRNLAAIPLGHSYGLGNLVMPLIQEGMELVCVGTYTPRQLVEWISHHEVTVFPAVPTLLRVLAGLPPGVLPKTLRTVISAGAHLDPEVAQAFKKQFGLPIHNFYGSSETGGICYDRTGGASLTGRSVGRPLKGVTVTVAKNRITVASAAVATRTGRWRPEDQGEWNARGELVLLGRGGTGANIGGKKVHPLEIERSLRSLPGVSDAVVWLHHRGGRDLLAAAVESAQTQAQIEKRLTEKLPAWKLPKWILVARRLPRTSRGKLDLAALRGRIHS